MGHTIFDDVFRTIMEKFPHSCVLALRYTK